jgi:hypothetical protein
MEGTSKTTHKVIPLRDRAYYRRRQQNKIFSRITQFFATEAAAGRISKKEIANKLDRDPAQITRWLSYPANLESDTISDLLLAMGAEMDHEIVSFADRKTPNYAHPAIAGYLGWSQSSNKLQSSQALTTTPAPTPQIVKIVDGSRMGGEIKANSQIELVEQ